MDPMQIVQKLSNRSHDTSSLRKILSYMLI